MGKYKAYIFLGAAIVIALITSVLAYNWLHHETSGRNRAMETQPVAVAAVDVPIGTALSKEMIKMVSFSKASISPGYFTDGASLDSRVVISAIKANEPILESRLAANSIKTGGIAAAITANKRAMAVKVDKIIGVSGFVHPGNRVDVLVTLSKGNDQKVITKIVLQNILVLAVGPEIQEKEKKEKPSTVDVITLEVTPDEGERLALAATEGKLQLALRNPSDTSGVVTAGTTVPALIAGQNLENVNKINPKTSRVSKISKKKIAASKSESIESGDDSDHTITVIRGKDAERVTFERRD